MRGLIPPQVVLRGTSSTGRITDIDNREVCLLLLRLLSKLEGS